MNYDRIQQQAGHLPAFQIADAINSTLKESANLIVTAPPGAGNPPCFHSPSSRLPHRAGF